MKIITAADANREFSNLLREVSKGEEITILSRGKPVARITSTKSEALQRNAMKELLLSRLKSQEVTGVRDWIRSELYEGS